MISFLLREDGLICHFLNLDFAYLGVQVFQGMALQNLCENEVFYKLKDYEFVIV